MRPLRHGPAAISDASTFRVPVNVPPGGRLFLNRGFVNLTAGSGLTVAGELELAGDARVRLDGNSPARDLALAAGSVLTGTGTIQLEGNCRLLVPGDLDSTVGVVLNGQGTQLVVPGIYTVRSNLSMQGQIQTGTTSNERSGWMNPRPTPISASTTVPITISHRP